MLREENKRGRSDAAPPLVEVKNLKRHFSITNALGQKVGKVRAVDGVSFHLSDQETFGLVGESGCGKSTVGRTLLRLEQPTDGEIKYKGKDILKLKGRELRRWRREIQMVFQNPHTSLNPQKRIGPAIMEAMKIHRLGTRAERLDLARQLLFRVGIRENQFYRYPHEFSGGERQRIGIARALAVNPKVIVCDEPVSALDVSIQAQIINLLEEIQEEFKLSYLFISHDLHVVRHISHRVGVMYLGRLVEMAPTDQLFQHPLHPYTQALLAAIPTAQFGVKRERIILEGDFPSPFAPPSGCPFHVRCHQATKKCKTSPPVLEEKEAGHYVACHLFD